MRKRPHWRRTRRTLWPVLLLLPIAGAHGQYVGKVGQGAAKKPTLRATAVYEYTGSMTKPNASRLVPVVVWDGERYQPGGLYLAQPEPLAVAAGTQYVLEQSGVPAGLFDVGAAARLNGGWIGMGRFAPNAPPPAPKKLLAMKKLPVLSGGAGRASATEDSDGPVLHRKAGSDPGEGGSPASSPSAPADPERPTLHRRDTDGASDGGSSPDTTSASTKPAPDPDRPTLHRPKDENPSSSAPNPAPDPDRPTLQRHAEASGSAAVAAPDPDRPHLRYGATAETDTRVLPTELKDIQATPADMAGGGAAGVSIGQVIAVSDTAAEEPHPFAYTWPSPQAQTQAQQAMHRLALHALAAAVHASFGPAAKSDEALRQAAAQADSEANAGSSFGPSAQARTRHAHAGAPALRNAVPDPLIDPQFRAFELSYGGGATYIYSAHTAAAGVARRYVTVIAQPDFQGRPQVVFSQTTRGDMLAQTPALRLIDAVDADGDHRAELLFDEQSAEGQPQNQAGRQFALYSVAGGQATVVYSSGPGVQQ